MIRRRLDNKEKAVIDAPKKKLKALRTKSVPRHTYTNFQQLTRSR
jgi:hypothetical protein